MSLRTGDWAVLKLPVPDTTAILMVKEVQFRESSYIVLFSEINGQICPFILTPPSTLSPISAWIVSKKEIWAHDETGLIGLLALYSPR